MARRTKLQLGTDDEPVLDVSSLIDVSFLLLIYFLVTSTLQKQEADLGLSLPADRTKAPTDEGIEPLPIRIDPDGTILVSGEVVEQPGDQRDLPTLFERVRNFKKLAKFAGQTAVVILDADNKAKQQRFVDVINTLAKVEIKAVTISGFRERN